MLESQITSAEISSELATLIDSLAERSLARSSFRIMQAARDSITISRKPSQPGSPPHSRRGALPQSIAFAVNRDQRTAFIGPRHSKVNRIGQTHEFGGSFRNRVYAPRPFMRPALERNLDYFAASFGGSLSR